MNQLDKFIPIAPVQTADNGDILYLLFGKFTVRPVNLGENIAGINKQDAVIFFGFIKKPESSGQGDGVKHVGRQGQHAVNEIFFNQFLSNIRLTVSGIGSGICHNKSRPSGRL